MDSTICEVSADTKHGASYGYTKQLGYHPLVAVRSETGEILHSRLRGGSSQKGAAHFVVEAVNRVRRAGAAGPLTVRADSGFWSYRLIADLDRLRVEGPDQNGGFKLNGGFREDATIVRGGTPQFETLVNPPLCRGIASPFCTHHDLGIEPITSQQ